MHPFFLDRRGKALPRSFVGKLVVILVPSIFLYVHHQVHSNCIHFLSRGTLTATMLRPSLRCSGCGLLTRTRFVKRLPYLSAPKKTSALPFPGSTAVSSFYVQQRGYAVAAADTDKGVVSCFSTSKTIPPLKQVLGSQRFLSAGQCRKLCR